MTGGRQDLEQLLLLTGDELEEQQAARLMTVEGKEALQKAIHDLLDERIKALNGSGEIKGVYFTQFVMQ